MYDFDSDQNWMDDTWRWIHQWRVYACTECMDGRMNVKNRGAVYLLGLVMPDPSLSVLLVRALADLTVNKEKDR